MIRFIKIIFKKLTRKSIFLHFLPFAPLISAIQTSDSDSPLNFTPEGMENQKKEEELKKFIRKIFKKFDFLMLNISLQDHFHRKRQNTYLMKFDEHHFKLKIIVGCLIQGGSISDNPYRSRVASVRKSAYLSCFVKKKVQCLIRSTF